MNTNSNKANRFTRMRRKPVFWIGAAVVVVLIIILVSLGRTGPAASQYITSPVIQGDLVIDVLEAGSVDSKDSLTIKSEVEGRTTIISIVPEGTVLTEEDIKNQRVLVELDSAELRDRETQEQIQVQSAEASLAEASASYEIQIKQNESNLKQGELKLQFAWMDLEKYLGDKLVNRFLDAQVPMEQLLDHPDLGGKALQELRTRENSIDSAKERKLQAEDTLHWTRELYEQDYVTRNELQKDVLSASSALRQLEQAETDLHLFRRYEFPKEVERLRSDYEEAQRELARIKARNQAEIAKAEARLKSNEATYNRRIEQLQKVQNQIAKCRIVATQPGLVVYAGSDQPWRSQNRIEEGAQVFERQEIIKIPNTASMIAKTNIHESFITRVREGQQATITIDALPDQTFQGKVTKVALLPETQSRWLNPNLKVYTTEISIEGANGVLKPGMSAQVRIVTDVLKDVPMVPIQAVTRRGDQSYCFIMGSSGPELREIAIGEYNDRFMQVSDGLQPGQQVVLNAAPLFEKYLPPLKEEATPTPLEFEAIERPEEQRDEAPSEAGPSERDTLQPEEASRPAPPEGQRGPRPEGARPERRQRPRVPAGDESS